MTFKAAKVIALKKSNVRRPRSSKVSDYKMDDLSRLIKDPAERKKYSTERAKHLKEIKELKDELRELLKSIAALNEERREVQALQLSYGLDNMAISSPGLPPVSVAEVMMESMSLEG